jgi:hypothetical protein
MSPKDLGATARKASDGSKKSMQTLANESAPDPQLVEDYKRLGISDYIDPGHVTTSGAYRQLDAALKNIPTTEPALVEAVNLKAISHRASALIEELGGTKDVSSLSENIKQRLMDTHTDLKETAAKLYNDIREAIPPGTSAPASRTLEFLEKKIADRRGVENLTKEERDIYRQLSPIDDRPATYANIDDVRRDLVDAKYAKSGPFKNSGDHLYDELYSVVRADQEAAAKAGGMGDAFNKAQATAESYIGIQKDLTSLFARSMDGAIDGSIAKKLPGSTAALARGDTSGMMRILRAVPDDMRKEVVVTGLASVFKKAAQRGEMDFTGYWKWYEGLTTNKASNAIIRANLAPEQLAQLDSLYRVSKGISDSLAARTKTGLQTEIMNSMRGSDSFVSNMYDALKKNRVAAVAGMAASQVPIIGPGIAAAVTIALSKSKVPAEKAIQLMIVSPEFKALATAATPQARRAAAARVSKSAGFKSYVRAVGQPAGTSDPEGWILNAMQVNNNTEPSAPPQ